MNQFSTGVLLSLSFFRILLEFYRPPWEKFPLARVLGQEQMMKVHRLGLFFAVGYFLLFLPEFLMGL